MVLEQVLFIIIIAASFMIYLIFADDTSWFGRNKLTIFYVTMGILTVVIWAIIGAFALTIAVFSFLVWMGNLT